MKNEIERTAGPELEVCNQPYPQSNQWGESTSEQTVEAMQENHQRRGRIYVITRPWSPNVWDSQLGIFRTCCQSQNF